MIRSIVVALLVVLLSGGVWLAWESLIFLNSTASKKDQKIYFEVKKGESAASVARRLEKENLITDDLRFRILLRLSKKLVRVGEYGLKPNMFPSEIMNILSSGVSVQHSFTIQEGLNIFEIAELYEKKGFGSKEKFLELCHDKNFIKKNLQKFISDEKEIESLEGYLFPETYNLTKYTETKAFVQKMVDQFLSVYQEIKSQSRVQLSPHDVVILASVIEKETGAPEERTLISSVYHNRLNKPMRLQADPTVLYGIWVETGKYKKNITKKDLRTPSPYNTYTQSGLPKGPIANPGKEALLAALQPETSPFYYFVSRNDGTHVFSEDYEAHKKAVSKYQLDRKAREGKSWRDLSERNKLTPSSAQSAN